MARRRTKAQLETERSEAERERVVAWADQYGAPISVLAGWDPESGEWDNQSPIGRMLLLIGGGNFVTTAAAAAGVKTIQQLIAKGAEFAIDSPEDRAYIPVDVRPFVDLYRAVERAESMAEVRLVKIVRDGANIDPKLALTMLSRRYATRWREQQAFVSHEDQDERDAAVSRLIADPNAALQLAELAHRLEDDAPNDDDI